MKRPSQRFEPGRWGRCLVPALLVLLSIGLLATLLIVVLAVLGLMPS